MATACCRAFTAELRSVAWPGKFKPDLPPHYDGTADPAEFLQLYELGIEAPNGDEKVMENWFPMALKDRARTWLLNLAPGMISSWDEMRSVAWSGKFKPDLPPRYDGMADPAKFLQLYELGIEAANRDEKVMAN